MGINNNVEGKKSTQWIWIAALALCAICLSSTLPNVVTNPGHVVSATPVEDMPQVDSIETHGETQKTTTIVPVVEDFNFQKEQEEEELHTRILQKSPSESPTSRRPTNAPTLNPTKAPTTIAPTSSQMLNTTSSRTLNTTTIKTIIQKRQYEGHNQTVITKKRNFSTRTHPTMSALSGASTSSINSSHLVDYDGTNSFAACLFWMDDSERLIEYIAYHYHVLPLRHLVLFKDPKSEEDPAHILDRWRPFMEITYWTSLDNLTYVPSKAILKAMEKETPLAYHNKQQGLFYRNCLGHLRKHKWKWTFVGDTDEILVLNPRSLPQAPQMMKEAGIILKTLQAAQSGKTTMELLPTNINNNNNNDTTTNNNTTTTVQETTTIIKNQKQQNRWGNNQTVCWCLSRQQFSGYESPQEAVAKDVPKVFDPYRFQTMRFRYHKRKGIIGKCIIDASRVRVYAHTRFSQHKLIRECGSPWGEGSDLMQVHHYLGTWDYFYRANDIRGKGEERYKTFLKKNMDVNKTITARLGDAARNWLSSFLQTFGKEQSLSLLEGVGFPFNNQTALPMLHVAK